MTLAQGASAAAPPSTTTSSSTSSAPPAPSTGKSASNNNNNNNNSSNNSVGRVVRLHFACRAPLPIGSHLRVTSSTLWAPSAITATDTSGAYAASAQMGDAAYHAGISGFAGGSLGMGGANVTTEETDGIGFTPPFMAQEGQHHYSSTVEMVTSPETYPLWRTRRPVVVVITASHSSNSSQDHPDDKHQHTSQHHRYRYMVVTPGADDLEQTHHDHETDETKGKKQGQQKNDNKSTTPQSVLKGLAGAGASTGYDADGSSIPVLLWEDPFLINDRESETGKDKATSTSSDTNSTSATSLPSIARRANGVATRTLANLPFRTIDIDVTTAQAVSGSKRQRRLFLDRDAHEKEAEEEDDEEIEKMDERDEYTDDGIRIDTWNNADDVSFQPYVIREAINRENRKLNRRDSDAMTDISDSVSDYGGESHTSSPTVEYGMHLTTLGPSTAPSSTGSVTPPPSKFKQRIFFVCFHLPVIVTQDPDTKEWKACWAESLLAKTEGSNVIKTHDAHWIGTVTTTPPIVHARDREAVRSILAAMDCTPLFLERDVREAHYLGMCKQILWPAFHNIDFLDLTTSGFIRNFGNNGGSSTTSDKSDDATSTSGNVLESDWDQSRLHSWWEAYVSVNRSFANALSSVIKPMDIIWVHDYHLSLLPQMLNTKECSEYGRSVTKKVFFLHIPFPTSQTFRELEWGESILRGMLNADVVGFHSFDHARHFLNASKRIFGLNYESLVGGLIGVQYRGKTVLVTMSNVSIEPKAVDAALSLTSVQSGANAIREKHRKKIIIGGIDIAQRLSGINFKLLAYERLLSDYPLWKRKLVLVQKCLIPGSRRLDESKTLRELRFLVRRIQEGFGRHVIDYEEILGSSLPIDQRLALWSASDILMMTPVSEGLNLLPLEYVFSRKEPAMPGVVIASEFSAVSSILNGALRINPFDLQASAGTIDKALIMDMQEREGRRARDIEFVSTSPSDKWTKNVLRDLHDATVGDSADEREIGDTGIIRSRHGGTERKELIDSTAAFLARENESAFTHLELDSVLGPYNCSKRRVIIMDFNGTIVIKEPPGKYLKRDILGTSGNKPPAAVIKALTTLCADPRNTVFVVSGDSQENVENAIGSIPGLGLAASNGACFARPISKGDTERTWETFDLGVDWDAVKKVALPVLSKYTARSNGSFVKLTHLSIGWSYYSCDPEWGALQASYLVLELANELSAFDVRFVTLKGVVEIVPRRLNKGLIVNKVLREVASGDSGAGVDFVLCMGDDISDEKMFTSVFSFVAEIDDDYPHLAMSSRDICGGCKSNSQFSTVHDPGSIGKLLPSARTRDSSKPMYVFTVAVGKKPSHASKYVNDARDVANLLISLSGEALPSIQSMDWEMVGTGETFFK